MPNLKLYEKKNVISNNQLQNTKGESKQNVYDELLDEYILQMILFMMTSSNGNIFRVTGPLCGEFTGHWWIPHHKGQWRGALVFSLKCARINGWENTRGASDLKRHRTHYDVTVMFLDNLPAAFDFNTYDNQWNGVFVIPLRWIHMNAT